MANKAYKFKGTEKGSDRVANRAYKFCGYKNAKTKNLALRE